MAQYNIIQRLIFRGKLKATRLKDTVSYMLLEGIEYALIDNRINQADVEFLKNYVE